MSAFGSYTREQLRQAYADAWQKQVGGQLLTAQETLIAEVIGLHPEYHPLVQDSSRTQDFEHNAAAPHENPFLHMGLHIAIREQLAIDRPPGVRDLHRRLHAQHADSHMAEHILMEALAETLWEAQRSGKAPDEARYLELARSRLKSRRP
jgi:hypothetical protein